MFKTKGYMVDTTDTHFSFHFNRRQIDGILGCLYDGVEDPDALFGVDGGGEGSGALLRRSHHVLLRVLVRLQ